MRVNCLMEPDELGLVHHCSWGLFYKEGVFSFAGPSKSLQISKWLFCCWFGPGPPPPKKIAKTLSWALAFLHHAQKGIKPHQRGSNRESDQTFYVQSRGGG